MITLEKSCCGCSLRTGTVMIGVLQLIWSASLFSSSIIIACIPEERVQTPHSRNYTEEVQGLIDYYVGVFSQVSIATVFIQAIQFILTVMLMYGAKNDSPRLVKPWIIYSSISLILTGVTYFVLMVLAFMYSFLAVAILLLLVTSIFVCANGYFILIVYSFHQELLDMQNQERLDMLKYSSRL